MCSNLVNYDYERCYDASKLAVRQFVMSHPETIPLFVDHAIQNTLQLHHIIFLGINEILGCDEKYEEDACRDCAKIWLKQQISHNHLKGPDRNEVS